MGNRTKQEESYLSHRVLLGHIQGLARIMKIKARGCMLRMTRLGRVKDAVLYKIPPSLANAGTRRLKQRRENMLMS